MGVGLGERACVDDAVFTFYHSNLFAERKVDPSPNKALRIAVQRSPGSHEFRLGLQSREHIATHRRREPAATIELRMGAREREGRRTGQAGWLRVGTEWDSAATETGTGEDVFLPRSLVHPSRPITEIEWNEAKAWADAKVTRKMHRYAQPGSVPASTDERLASTFRRLKTGRRLAGRASSGQRTAYCRVPAVPVQAPDEGADEPD